MLLNDVDGLYSFKCSSLVNVALGLRILCTSGELMEYNYTFVNKTRQLYR